MSPTSIFSPALRATSTGLLIVITMIAFEAMAVSAALPTAARDVHGLASYGWAFTGFLVANVVAMVVSGQLSDERGPRSPLVAGLVCFALGLAVAGSATTMLQLVAGRVVQGFGGGLLITAVYVVIGETFPPELQPRLFAATASAWVVPSLVGPIIAGVLTEHASWRWVFLGLLPFVFLGAALLIPVLRRLKPRHRQIPRGRNRVVPALAVAIGVAALEQAGQHPSAWSAVIAVVGLVVLVWGLRSLLPRGTFRVRPGVPAPVALRGLLAGAFFGVEATVPLSLTLQHGYGPVAAGLPLAGAGITWAIGSWVQGRADDTRGAHVRVMLIRTGFAFAVLATGVMAIAVLPGAAGWLAYLAWMAGGFGAGLAMSSVSVLLLRFTSDAQRGADSAAMQLSDATATALTTGIAGVLIAAAARHAFGFTAAFATFDLAMAGVACMGVLASTRARPAVAAAP